MNRSPRLPVKLLKGVWSSSEETFCWHQGFEKKTYFCMDVEEKLQTSRLFDLFEKGFVRVGAIVWLSGSPTLAQTGARSCT